MDLDRVCYLYMEIDSFLNKYGDPQMRNQHLLVKDTIDILSFSENEETKIGLLIQSYKSLFIGRSGLTEFYVWDKDYEKRIALNMPFIRATEELWEIMKSFM